MRRGKLQTKQVDDGCPVLELLLHALELVCERARTGTRTCKCKCWRMRLGDQAPPWAWVRSGCSSLCARGRSAVVILPQPWSRFTAFFSPGGSVAIYHHPTPWLPSGLPWRFFDAHAASMQRGSSRLGHHGACTSALPSWAQSSLTGVRRCSLTMSSCVGLI